MPGTEDDDFNEEAFKNLGETPTTPPIADPKDPPAQPSAPAEPPKDDKTNEEEKDADKSKSGDQSSDPAKPDDQKPTTPENNKPDDKEEKPGDGKETQPPAPPPLEEPKPLTKDDVESVVSNLLNTERSSSKELDTASKEVLDAYYPDGLSNILVDEKSGKELRSPADVVEASGDQMSTEDAAQWLMNEQFKLDKQLDSIRNQARDIAETTVNFKRDSTMVLEKYEPLFKAYPSLQEKVFKKLMQQVKVDKEKNVILSAPDVMDHYDFYLEPYQKAFEYANNKPATNPTPNPNEPPKPTAEDRMDESGDGGQEKPNDPNDFAQQVKKELMKGI